VRLPYARTTGVARAEALRRDRTGRYECRMPDRRRPRRAGRGRVLRLASLLALAACTGARAPAPRAAPLAPAAYRAIVDAPDRSDADRALDAGRHPAELLAFIGAHPGMRVAELAAAGGYTTELLARAVAPGGRVWGQNDAFILHRFAEAPWSARLATPAMRNVVRVDRPFEDPLPPDARDLDAVVIVLFYHDLYWFGTDRAAMNRAVFERLRPGGEFVVVDHSAAPGAGASGAGTLHRVEESLVRGEIEAAGFRLARTADFLRNPADRRDWNASPRAAGTRRGTSDRFVLGFVKPR
jgi:predicted methyltransferase